MFLHQTGMNTRETSHRPAPASPRYRSRRVPAGAGQTMDLLQPRARRASGPEVRPPGAHGAAAGAPPFSGTPRPRRGLRSSWRPRAETTARTPRTAPTPRPSAGPAPRTLPETRPTTHRRLPGCPQFEWAPRLLIGCWPSRPASPSDWLLAGAAF